MKQVFIAALITLFGCSAVFAQDKKLPPLDSSPMDMAYYPVMYPYVVKVKGEPGTLVARVIYSRPQKKGRKIFGDLEPYGELYRLGANEATEVEFYRPVSIGGKLVPKGRYTMYAIPNETKWTIIINRDTDVWGAFKYSESKDVVRTEIPVTKMDTPVEPFTMVFEKADHGANLIIAWDVVSVSLPVKFSNTTAPVKK
ncbi:DUF2911 domain-containing protein [Chitinophaga sancti]|uniref:DUF2911 domain-containing protein n=1 Tax=Chitinophaga sancti TaxID=1004 RepID=A0A1K1NW14_9BACT|nr:DUF2911 domain-containing protein [Chitinophaga sancti]WQD60230.1 DUF2911 domain-containing protein [Chitinophaga sancti]WQG87642.1 DUF2911 domain-containing protein [Chitinophaga sancti]SFW39487.1 Protein of unknown function [Chitinophaga sancti]